LAKNAWRRLIAVVIAVLFVSINATYGLADPLRKAAVFDFELIDTSLEGEKRGTDPAETARLAKISDALREGLAAAGRYEIVPTAPVAKQVAEAGHLHGCNGCELPIARGLGADTAIIGHVQKISTLILSLTITVKDAATGARLQTVTADIRGNTDESWLHGVRWLVRNRLAQK
jgi:hypothetical protein